MVLKSTIASLVLLASSAQLLAENYVFQGAGTASCGKFAEDFAKAPDFSEGFYFAWAQGFMSALNIDLSQESAQYRNLGAIPTSQQERYLRNYCDQHPLGDYMDGVIALFKTIPLAEMPSSSASER
jgi:hypothetical protein